MRKNTVRDATPAFEGIIGSSRPMLELFQVIGKVARVDVPVLLLGESGTGKETVANAIHRLSPRSDKPLSIINCGAIPGDLLESELFGYEKGAFTGAEERRKGRIELAEGGTLFLDEVGELTPRMQVKLLRFLQERTIERLGSHTSITVNARVISATNRDLKALAGKGLFRDDLYYRLAVVNVTMPPLRERHGDLHRLALYFLKKYCKQFNAATRGFGKTALAALESHDWPGNVRELENRIRRAIVLSRGAEITPPDLDLGAPEDIAPSNNENGLFEARESFKIQLISAALLRNNGAVNRTASELGISRQYLSRLITRYNMRRDDA